MLKAILLVVLSILASWAFAAEDHATISLQRHKNFIVVTLDHEAGWHTYWKNPGDSGLPSSFKFQQNNKAITIKAHEWPVPTRYMEAGDILTIGYSGRKHFFFDAVNGEVEALVSVLICKDVCIPGEAKLKLGTTQSFVANRIAKEYSSSELNEAFENLPKEEKTPAEFNYYLTRVKGQNNLTLHYSLKGVKSKKLPHELNFLTAFPHVPFGFKREKLFHQDETLYGKMEIEWDGEYQEPPVNLPENGRFNEVQKLEFLYNSPSNKDVSKISLEIKDFSFASDSLDKFYQGLPPFDGSEKKVVQNSNSLDAKSFLQYLFFAFMGGLILNLMPCVLPVISLKLFGLIKHRNTPKQRLLAHNLSYTAGVISTFIVLAIVIVAIKATGEQIGWGFQLQSPTFILFMMLILFILSLNLFGLFEFVTPGGTKLGGRPIDESLKGDFFSGILTTILSTPCSAPFLGTALTFAFTTSTTSIFVIFIFIGLGLAFPFLLTAFFPQSLYFFPKPGAWMEKLKYFLGLSLIITVVWLYDVFVSLVNFDLISWRLNLIFALWFFAFFFAQKISQKKILQFIIFAIPLSLTVIFLQNLEHKKFTPNREISRTNWTPWTEEKMKETKGKHVFVDFTAEWCLTCKVNKKLVLETDGFEALKAKYQMQTMRADWTRRDDNITEFLKRHGAVGVPAYFIQMPDGSLKSLGETITISKIEENLN